MVYIIVLTYIFILCSYSTNEIIRDIQISYKPGILRKNQTSFNRLILYLFEYKNNQYRILYWLKNFKHIWFCVATIILIFTYLNKWYLNGLFASIYLSITVIIYIVLGLIPRLLLDIQKIILKKSINGSKDN